MRRPTQASRFVTLLSLVAMVGSLFAVTAPAVFAAEPIEGLRTTLSHRADPSNGDARSYREVDVSRLPQGPGTPSTANPNVAPRRSAAAPQTVLGGAAPPVQATTSSTAATLEPTSWAGLAANGPIEPPDSGVAAGPNHIVQVAATGVRITNRSGSQLALVSLKHFFGLLAIPGYEAEAFNPRVLYDTLHDRWLAIGTSFDCYQDPDNGVETGRGFINVAYSETADPTGLWGIVPLEFPDFVPDELGIGTSTDKIVVSTDVVELIPGGGEFGCSGSDFVGTQLDAMLWTEVLGGDVMHRVTWHTDFAPSPNLPNEFQTWQPSRQTPATSETVYIAGNRFDSGFAYATISGNPAGVGSAVLDIKNLTSANLIAGFTGSPDPQQPGQPSPISDAANGLPTDAVWQAERMVISSSLGCDPAGGIVETRACVRVTELDTGSALPTRTIDFLIAQPGMDLYMGGAALALNGDLHVVWTRSSGIPGQYPSSQTAAQLANTDSRNTIGVRSTIAAGIGTYPGSQWGDYAGIAFDPEQPDAVWQANQYSAGANYWATHVSQLRATGSSYTPIAPRRVLDTRPGFAIGLSGRFSANVPRSWQVAGVGAIPADAIAVTGNVTVANQTAAGYVSVTPSAVANPTSSTINFPLGDTRANNLTVPLSHGKLAATYKAPAGQTTHLIFDVTGYFTAGNADGTYNPVPSVRALDSRFGIGLAGTFAEGVPRQLNITGLPAIPADATAITGNLTVVGQTRAGYLSITKTNVPNPTTSNLNFPLGDIRANGISVPLNAGGGLWIVYKASGGSTHVILDVTGYYRNDPSGLLYFPLSPFRLMDTRPGVPLTGLDGPFEASIPRPLLVADEGGARVPAEAEAFTGNMTVVHQTSGGYVSATLNSEVHPTTSVINFPLGDTRANGVTLPLNDGGRTWFVYKAPSGKLTHLILDITGYFR